MYHHLEISHRKGNWQYHHNFKLKGNYLRHVLFKAMFNEKFMTRFMLQRTGHQKIALSPIVSQKTHLLLLYSNSMCKQSSIPTSICKTRVTQYQQVTWFKQCITRCLQLSCFKRKYLCDQNSMTIRNLYVWAQVVAKSNHIYSDQGLIVINVAVYNS